MATRSSSTSTCRASTGVRTRRSSARRSSPSASDRRRPLRSALRWHAAGVELVEELRAAGRLVVLAEGRRGPAQAPHTGQEATVVLVGLPPVATPPPAAAPQAVQPPVVADAVTGVRRHVVPGQVAE